MFLPSIKFLHLMPGKDFTVQSQYSKAKSRLHHDVAHLQPLSYVPTKYQLPTPYGFRDIARTRF